MTSMLRRISIPLFILCLVPGICPAMGTVQHMVSEQALANWEKVESFTGVVEEKGLLPDNGVIRTEVRFEKPDRFFARTLAPESLAGDFFLFDGRDSRTYIARSHSGLLVSGLAQLLGDSLEKQRQRFRENMEKGLKTFRVSMEVNQDVAKAECVVFHFAPRDEAGFARRQQTWSDLVYSMPLKAEIYNSGPGIWYGFEYKEVSVNKATGTPAWPKGFPENTSVAVWDFSDPSVTPEQAKKALNADLALPRAPGFSMECKRIVMARSMAPAVATVYTGGPYYVLITQMKDYGIVDPAGDRGLAVPTLPNGARMHFFGENAVISWTENGSSITVTGNLPYFEMIGVAKSVR
ncbi:MAG: DUF4367 domain-containing protein [Proteobacteria bacterium]|nr:DUF4367 domain-containing protein [Pseudomonadota bacterium]